MSTVSIPEAQLAQGVPEFLAWLIKCMNDLTGQESTPRILSWSWSENDHIEDSHGVGPSLSTWSRVLYTERHIKDTFALKTMHYSYAWNYPHVFIFPSLLPVPKFQSSRFSKALPWQHFSLMGTRVAPRVQGLRHSVYCLKTQERKEHKTLRDSLRKPQEGRGKGHLEPRLPRPVYIIIPAGKL